MVTFSRVHLHREQIKCPWLLIDREEEILAGSFALKSSSPHETAPILNTQTETYTALHAAVVKISGSKNREPSII